MGKSNPNAQSSQGGATDTSEETPTGNEGSEEEEETTEEESSEGSGDEGAEGGDEEAETEDSEEEEEDPNQSLFFDPNKLPKELLGPFKRMQASFTRKMQALKGSEKKAAAFDELVAMPEFKSFIKQLREGNGSSGGSDQGDGEDKKGSSKGGTPTIQDMIKAAIREELGPIRQDGERARTAAALTEELKQFKEDYPEWENYREEMRDLLEKKPHFSYEEAFKLVAFPDLLKKEGQLAAKGLSRRRALSTVTKPGSKGVGKTGGKLKTINSVMEAFEAAEAEHGRLS